MLHIFTLNWQGKDKISKLKTSIIPALSDIDYTWHIKDNNSTDGSVEEIKNWNDININLIEYPNNQQSYSQGMNLLFKEASPKSDDIVLTLNNDVVFNNTNSIKNMLKILLEDDNIGVLGAKLNYTNTDKLQHCGVLFHNNGLPFHYRGGLSESHRDRRDRYYPAVTGAVSMLKADVFANCYKNKSGNVGFNENYFWAFEDIDMCMRAQYHLKKQNLYCGNTNIFHEESGSLKKNPVNKMFVNNNIKQFMENWHKEIDILLTKKYEDENYALYKGKL